MRFLFYLHCGSFFCDGATAVHTFRCTHVHSPGGEALRTFRLRDRIDGQRHDIINHWAD